MEKYIPSCGYIPSLYTQFIHNWVYIFPSCFFGTYSDVLCSEECQTKKLLVCCKMFAFFKAICNILSYALRLKKILQAPFAKEFVFTGTKIFREVCTHYKCFSYPLLFTCLLLITVLLISLIIRPCSKQNEGAL